MLGPRNSEKDSIIWCNTVHTFVYSSSLEGCHEGKDAIKRAQEHPTKRHIESDKWIQIVSTNVKRQTLQIGG